jgi:hypothetical protein
MKQTAKFIRTVVLQVVSTHSPTFHRLSAQLKGVGIDVLGEGDEIMISAPTSNPYPSGRSPEGMLELFEDFLITPPEEGQPMEQIGSPLTMSASPSSASITPSSTDPSELEIAKSVSNRGDLAVTEASFVKAITKLYHNSRGSGQRRSVFQGWSKDDLKKFKNISDLLRMKINEYRQSSFYGLPIESFGSLRNAHLLLEPNGY